MEEFNYIDRLPKELSLNDFEGMYHNVNVLLDKKDNIIIISNSREGPIFKFQVDLSKSAKLLECYKSVERLTIPFLNHSLCGNIRQ